MSDRERINIWGTPTTKQATTPTPPSTNTPAASVNGQSTAAELPLTKRIRYGISDVVWGFVLMFVLQFVIIFAAMFIKIGDIVSNGGNVENTDAILNEVLDLTTSGPFILVTSLSMYLSWWLVIRRASKKRGLGSYLKDFWVKFKWKRDLVIAVIFTITFRLFETGAYWLLEQAGVDLSNAGNTGIVMSMEGIWLFLNAVVVASFLAPLFEELFFRGLMMQALMRVAQRSRKRAKGVSTWASKHRATIAITISSIVFGLMHWQGTNEFTSWLVVFQTGLLGAVLAVITIRTKRLGPAILAHILFNFSGVALVFLGA